MSELEPGYGAGEAEFPSGHTEPAATHPAEAGDAVLDSRVAAESSGVSDSPVAAESQADLESRSASASSVAAESSVVSDSPGASVVSDSPVAAAMAELDRLPERELAEHPDVYQRIHSELQGALAAIDDA